MSKPDILGLYLGIRSQAVRWEGLQLYRVSWEDDQIAAWARAAPLPRSPEIEASLETIQRIAGSGRRIVRVRGVRRPLSEYTRYELEAAYPANAAAGEQISVVDLDEHPEFDGVCDFVIFDDDAVVRYRYDGAGRLLAYDFTDLPQDLTDYRDVRQRLLAAAVPLGEFIARLQ